MVNDWPMVLWSAASPLAALAGAYLGARTVNRLQFRDGRRIEAAETVLAFLYQLQTDFVSHLDLLGAIGERIDKRVEGQLFGAKLNQLSNYRRSHSLWLDTWADRETAEALDLTIRRMGDLSRDYYNTMPADPQDLRRFPEGTFSAHEEATEAAQLWTQEELPRLVEKIEAGLVGRLVRTRPSWWPRVSGGR